MLRIDVDAADRGVVGDIAASGANRSSPGSGAAADTQARRPGSDAEAKRISLTNTDAASGQRPSTRASKTRRFTTRLAALADADACSMCHCPIPSKTGLILTVRNP
jgi:hypothetical protein